MSRYASPAGKAARGRSDGGENEQAMTIELANLQIEVGSLEKSKVPSAKASYLFCFAESLKKGLMPRQQGKVHIHVGIHVSKRYGRFFSDDPTILHSVFFGQ